MACDFSDVYIKKWLKLWPVPLLTCLIRNFEQSPLILSSEKRVPSGAKMNSAVGSGKPRKVCESRVPHAKSQLIPPSLGDLGERKRVDKYKE